jgi:hypothetical protein
VVADQLPGWDSTDPAVLDLLTATMLVRYDNRADTPLKTRFLLSLQREGLTEALADGLRRWSKQKARLVDWLRRGFGHREN